MLTRYQVVTTGQGKVLDISVPAVKAAMDACGIKNQGAVMYRVVGLFRNSMGDKFK